MPFTQLEPIRKTGFLEGLVTSIEASGKFVDNYLAGQEKARKKQKDIVDAYITLRKAGYSEKASMEGAHGNLARMRNEPYKGDLETKKTEKEIEKLDTDIAFKKKQTENMGKGGGGFDTSDEVPSSAGGLPLKSIRQDKKTGLWYGNYDKEPGKKDFNDIYSSLEDPTEKVRKGVEDGSKWAPPSWLSGIIGKMERPSGAAEAKKPLGSGTGKTKKGVAYSYKRK
jgi:hypothetical protein